MNGVTLASQFSTAPTFFFVWRQRGRSVLFPLSQISALINYSLTNSPTRKADPTRDYGKKKWVNLSIDVPTRVSFYLSRELTFSDEWFGNSLGTIGILNREKRKKMDECSFRRSGRFVYGMVIDSIRLSFPWDSIFLFGPIFRRIHFHLLQFLLPFYSPMRHTRSFLAPLFLQNAFKWPIISEWTTSSLRKIITINVTTALVAIAKG